MSREPPAKRAKLVKRAERRAKEPDLIQVASALAHLLEHADTGNVLDYGAAISNLQHSGLIEWARQNAVLLPLRRDGKPQHERMTVRLV